MKNLQEGKSDTVQVEGNKEEGKASANTTQTNNENEEEEDKIWEDVHKDIGDILQETQCDNKFDDDEDEDSIANDERYDR